MRYKIQAKHCQHKEKSIITFTYECINVQIQILFCLCWFRLHFAHTQLSLRMVSKIYKDEIVRACNISSWNGSFVNAWNTNKNSELRLPTSTLTRFHYLLRSAFWHAIYDCQNLTQLPRTLQGRSARLSRSQPSAFEFHIVAIVGLWLGGHTWPGGQGT